ncbi:MAG: DMT family transporter [Acidimicrobiales bacterium]|nr:DMT family transporter [Acidimicrobiales bacterium]
MSATAVSIDESDAALGRVAAVAAISCWAIGNVMVVKAPIGGLQLAFWRVLLGAVVYTAFVYARGQTLSRAELRDSFLAGAVIGIEIAIFFVALKRTTVATATIIGAFQPLLVFAVASRQFGEKITKGLLAVAGVALAGAALVVFGTSSSGEWSLEGDLLAALATVFFAAYFIVAKMARAKVRALQFQTAAWIASAVVLAPIALVDAGGVEFPSSRAWVWIVALLAVPGSGHFLMNWAHPRVALSLTSMLTLAIPVISTAGGALFLTGQSISAVQVVGMVIVLGALAAVIRRDVAMRTAQSD